MRIWIPLWATQRIKSLTPRQQLVCSSGMQKLPQVQHSNAVWNNKIKCNSLHRETSDILKIYAGWPPFSAPHPFLQGLCGGSGARREMPASGQSVPWHHGSCQSTAARGGTRLRGTPASQPADSIRSRNLEGQRWGLQNCSLSVFPAQLFRKHWMFHLETTLLVFCPKQALKQLDAKKGWT